MMVSGIADLLLIVIFVEIGRQGRQQATRQAFMIFLKTICQVQAHDPRPLRRWRYFRPIFMRHLGADCRRGASRKCT